jgi:putative heme-binding domain-containing protein
MHVSRLLVVSLMLLAVSVHGQDQSTLQQKLSKEPLSRLIKDVRSRGDAARGAVLFFQPFLTCAKCHDSQAGTQLGPDLAKIGKDGTAEHLIESVLSPSKVIKKGYETVTIATRDGRTHTGLFVSDKNGNITLIDPAAQGKQIQISSAEIDERKISQQSLMPDGLVNLLSDRQQFLDLAKYLIEIAEQGPTSGQ